MTELSVEHILLFVIIAFILYHSTNGCRGNGFSVGVGPDTNGTQHQLQHQYEENVRML